MISQARENLIVTITALRIKTVEGRCTVEEGTKVGKCIWTYRECGLARHRASRDCLQRPIVRASSGNTSSPVTSPIKCQKPTTPTLVRKTSWISNPDKQTPSPQHQRRLCTMSVLPAPNSLFRTPLPINCGLMEHHTPGSTISHAAPGLMPTSPALAKTYSTPSLPRQSQRPPFLSPLTRDLRAGLIQPQLPNKTRRGPRAGMTIRVAVWTTTPGREDDISDSPGR